MLATAGETSELNKLYDSLRRDPEVRVIENNANELDEGYESESGYPDFVRIVTHYC